MHPPAGGEEEDRVVGRSDEHVLDEVLFASGHADLPATAAALRAVLADRNALDVARVRDRDDDVLATDQVLDREVVGGSSMIVVRRSSP